MKAKGWTWIREAGSVWRFGLKFAGLMVAYYFLILTPLCDQAFYAYLRVNASLANRILAVLGQHTQVSEITISSTRFAITVRRGCDAIEPAWFFCAALISFPASFTRKLPGVLIGATVLQGLNLVRIVSLYFIGLYYPGFFGTAHVEIWPVVFIVVAILLWIGWIRWARPQTHSALHATA